MKSVSEMALEALGASNFTRAIELYKIAISIEPASLEAWNNIGICYAQSGKPRKATYCFKNLYHTNKNSPSISFNYAKSLLESDFYKLAASTFKECLRIDPGNVLLHLGAARSLSKMGNIDASLACYRSAISLEPANSPVMSGMGMAMEKVGLDERALTFFKRALAADSSNNEAMVGYLKHQLQENGSGDLKNHICDVTENLTVRLEIISELIKRRQTKKASKLIRGYSGYRNKNIPNVYRGAYKNGFILATSVAPKNLDLQYSCLMEWIRQGFEVASINTEKEISKIYSMDRRFSRINFVPAHRSCNLFGKPLIYIDDMINYITTCSREYVGIVNSDIMPAADASKSIFGKYRKDLEQGSLVYSRRTDVNTLSNGTTVDKAEFPFGFDMFFSSAGSMMTVGRSPLVFGAPWWDYWLPLCYCANRLSISEITEEIGFHVRHDTNWSEEAYKNCGVEFLNALGKLIGMPQNSSIDAENSARQMESIHLLKEMFTTISEKMSESETLSFNDLQLANVVTLGAIDFYAGKSLPVSD